VVFRKPGFGLVAKFSFLVSLPILIASLALGYGLVKFVEKTMRIGMRERGKGIARLVSSAAEYGILVGNREILNNVLRNMLKGEDVLYVSIRNISEETLYSYGEVVEGIPTSVMSDRPFIHEQGTEFNFRIAETELLVDVTCDVLTVRERRSREDIGLLQPDTNPAQRSGKTEKIGTLRIGLSKAAMMKYLRSAKLATAGLAAIITTLVILATVMLVRTMIKPIKRLAKAAGEVSQGNFDHPVEVKSQDEIGFLADSFNKMMTDLKESSGKLQYRLEIERLVATMSTDFINLPLDEIDDGINRALQAIGEFTSVNRSYIFLISRDGKRMDNAYEWCAEGVGPRIDKLRDIPAEAIPWWTNRHNRFELIHIPRIADLPSEANAENGITLSQDTGSTVMVPMIHGGTIVGFLGFDSTESENTWMEEDTALVRMVGEIFVNALERMRSEEMLQNRLEIEERITKELEAKTEELSKSNTELNSFVYTVSHDLKAPVVSLQGFSSLLMKDCKDSLDEMGRMYIDRILKNSERMGTLIEDLLELSRIGRMEGQAEPVSISDIVSNVADELATQLGEKGTKLEVKGDMPTLLCNRTRVSQIFANLIGNANKFMGEDNEAPTIEVGCEDQESYYRFYVKDNGIGIDEEYHEKIFQIFQRLDDIDTEGTGVGLAIVRKIVESLGGKIWVDSAKGQGTTMYFTMPKTMNVDNKAVEETAK